MDKLSAVRAYYEKLESRIGYNLILWGAKHFGFYPDGVANIDERCAQKLMQDLLAEKLALQKGDYLLDAGCGQGGVATYLATNYDCSVEGITIVPFEVGSARKLARIFSADCSFEEMDYSNTNFPDNHFDAVYTTEALVHSPDVTKTLAEFYRVLKPGGRLGLFEYTIDEDLQFSTDEIAELDWVIEKSAMHGLKSFRHNRFVSAIVSTGFKDVTKEDISKNITPSFLRLYRKAKYPYKVIKLLRLQNVFLNTTSAIKMYKVYKKGLLHYCIFTARKPILTATT